ncbi:MAG: hypothetical protein QM496_17085 [Verrucomicrobiota bacterium]
MMKKNFLSRILLPGVLLYGFCLFPPLMPKGQAQELTPDQIEKISAQLAAIRKVLKEKSSDRNQNAADVFLSASGSGKAALALYVQCYKKVNFEMEGREDSEFRDWRDGQSDRFRNDAFIEGLRLQLKYLGLSCKAAEAEKLSSVFGDLMSYVNSLTQLKEMPGNEAMQSINGTVFAKAYELDKQLAKNKSWESVPYNIAGIYEKTILPYLREESPERLASAWDKRIEQETQVVVFLEKEKAKQQKGSRDDKRAVRNKQAQRRQGNGGTVLRTHDKEFFIRETLPGLKWGKLVDLFKYENRPKAAMEMLNFIKENIKNPKAEEWMSTFTALLAEPAAETVAPVESAPPAVTPAAVPNKASNPGSSKSGKVPAGFDS